MRRLTALKKSSVKVVGQVSHQRHIKRSLIAAESGLVTAENKTLLISFPRDEGATSMGLTPNNGQCQVQLTHGQDMEIPDFHMSCILWVIWDVEFDGDWA